MKLLFDQNLSPKLVANLADLFSDSSHVQAVGLDRASDVEVWEYAQLNRFAIVSKHEDFSDLSGYARKPSEGCLAADRQLHDCSSRSSLSSSL